MSPIYKDSGCPRLELVLPTKIKLSLLVISPNPEGDVS